VQFLVYDIQVHADWVERDAFLDSFICFGNTQLTKYKKWKVQSPKQTFKIWFSDMQGKKLRVKADVIQKFVAIQLGDSLMPIRHEDIVVVTGATGCSHYNTILLSILTDPAREDPLTDGNLRFTPEGGTEEVNRPFAELTKIENGKATIIKLTTIPPENGEGEPTVTTTTYIIDLTDLVIEWQYKGKTIVLDMVDKLTVKILDSHIQSEWIDPTEPVNYSEVVRAPPCCASEISPEVFIKSFVLELLLVF
jgi:hypothetical protein